MGESGQLARGVTVGLPSQGAGWQAGLRPCWGLSQKGSPAAPGERLGELGRVEHEAMAVLGPSRRPSWVSCGPLRPGGRKPPGPASLVRSPLGWSSG